MEIRLVQRHDRDAWERMRARLWPAPPGEHAVEIASFFGGARSDPAEVFVADDGGALVGSARTRKGASGGGSPFRPQPINDPDRSINDQRSTI